MNNPSVHRISSIKAAIAHCSTHCSHPVLSPGFIPTRLLFVGSDTDPTIRVVITQDTSQSTPDSSNSNVKYKYSALSYCWGPPLEASKQCTTTTSTLPSRRKEIPWDELSHIVQDATTVTRRLGLSYLWIDALCILQDDISDWERESAVMGKIYSNAWVTIVGLNSGSCAKGFLNGRWSAPLLAPSARLVDLREEENDSDSGLDEELLGQEEENIDPSTWKFASAMSKARWTSRGWTFQEKALSTRLLYFDNLNVHLRCANFTFREGRRGPLLGRQLAFLEPAGHGDTEIVQAQTGEKYLCEDLLQSWRNIFIPRFATCEFSRATDNLPAISGLAKYIAKVSGRRYAAGLWVEELWREVVWYGRSARKKSVPSSQGGFVDLMTWLGEKTEYIGPSWSWAREGGGMARLEFLDLPAMQSLDGEGSRVDVAARFEVKTHLKGLNPYGQVTGGELVVTCKILPLLPDEYAKDDSGFELDWNVKSSGRLPEGLEMVLIGRYRARERMPVRLWPDSIHVEHWRVYGLVVCCSPVVMGKYYRVGIFSRSVSGEGWLDFGAARAETIAIV